MDVAHSKSYERSFSHPILKPNGANLSSVVGQVGAKWVQFRGDFGQLGSMWSRIGPGGTFTHPTNQPRFTPPLGLCLSVTCGPFTPQPLANPALIHPAILAPFSYATRHRCHRSQPSTAPAQIAQRHRSGGAVRLYGSGTGAPNGFVAAHASSKSIRVRALRSVHRPRIAHIMQPCAGGRNISTENWIQAGFQSA